MAKVALAGGAVDFRAGHAVAAVGWGRPARSIACRGPESRPAAAALVFGVRREDFRAAAGAAENARPLFVIQLARARPLGAMAAQHMLGFGGEGLGDGFSVGHGGLLRSVPMIWDRGGIFREALPRSEERRGGKECGSSCKSRGSPYP